MAKKRLRLGDGPICGVCAGIGDYLEVDPVFVRLAFGVMMLTGIPGFFIYGLLFISMPYPDNR